MSASTGVVISDVLTSLGFDSQRQSEARDRIDMTVDTFDTWSNPQATMEGPLRGCITFRDDESEAVPA